MAQREEGRKELGLNILKGNYSKVNETQGFLTLGHSLDHLRPVKLISYFYPLTFPPYFIMDADEDGNFACRKLAVN